MPKTSEASLRGQVAANERWGRTSAAARQTSTLPGRQAFRQRFLDAVPSEIQISRLGTRPSCWMSCHEPSSRSSVWRVGII